MTSARSLSEVRSATSSRLRGRRDEVNGAVIHRALSVAPPTGREAPGYVDELRAAIPCAVEHAFDAIELGEERLGPTPAAILRQAAASARNGVGLDAVLRRYASGYSTLSDFLHQEVNTLSRTSPEAYPVLQRELTALFDRLVAEVSEAYRREEVGATPSRRQRELNRVRKLLAGDFADTTVFAYEFGAWHQALIARSPEATESLRELAVRLDRRLLAVEADESTVWAWLGGRNAFERDELDLIAGYAWPEDALITTGIPGRGLGGWRLSHRQASAAITVAMRRRRPFTNYDDVALSAAILRDEELISYLKDAILRPLASARGGGEGLRETLRAYFESGDNVSSTASVLGVSRQTVTARLRMVEERLDQTITTCRAEIEAALTVDALRD